MVLTNKCGILSDSVQVILLNQRKEQQIVVINPIADVCPLRMTLNGAF